MNANTIAAESGALEKGANAVDIAYAAVSRDIDGVRGDLSQLDGYWAGGAHQAYVTLVQAWSADAAKLASALTELRASLRGTASDQAATEQDQTTTIRGLGSMMTGKD